MTKTELAQVVVHALYELKQTPEWDDPRVLDLVRRRKKVTLEHHYKLALKAMASDPLSYCLTTDTLGS